MRRYLLVTKSFRVYERGIEVFGYPIAFEIWNLYLVKFIARFSGSKLERTRDLFEHALEACPANLSKPIFLMYAKFEEDYGLARRALKIYDRATKTVLLDELHEIFNVYIAKAGEFFGIPATREIFTKALEVLPDKHAADLSLKFTAMEVKLGEVDRARTIFGYASQFCDPRTDAKFWAAWHEFEVQYGNEDLYKEMLK
jgi:pre-mRNA-splicing factor SYF1